MSLPYDGLYSTQSLALLDENFLATLSEQRDREIYARIAALDFNENPIDQIEGRVTGGSINIDGSSTIRRTCSLTMITDQIDINDFYWGIKTKFKLEIGLRNKLTGDFAPSKNGLYPEIVWFSQGYFIVSGFNTSISTNSCTISLSGKDKMSLLNGDLGGQLFASIDFGTEETTTKVMEPVSLVTNANSEGITIKDYYIKPEITSETEREILSSNPLYSFIINQKEGNYRKNEQIYQRVEGAVDRENSHFKYYDMYKKVEYPFELYKNVTDEIEDNYKPNTYYYKKADEVDYYILDTTSSKVSGRTYYQLVPLYQQYTNIVKKQITLEKIIREAVHAYAKEPYHNIIINDLEDYGLEQLTYKGDQTLYALYEVDKGEFTQLVLEGKNQDLEEQLKKNDFHFYSTEDIGTIITLREKKYSVFKITYGTDVGYRLTDLVYAGDLISSIGDTLTSVLDKIKDMLGEFEYFYDVDGRFVFQRKKTYVNTSWSQLTNNEDEYYVDYANDKQKFAFNFEGNRLISAIQNTPVLNNLRNDFTVWGQRKSTSGADIPIHARYAIDKKPVYYKALNNKIYTVDKSYAIEQGVLPEEDNMPVVDIENEIKNFKLQYGTVKGLTAPKSNGDGTWTPGWWDIRDWARYYKLLTNTEDDPNGTMKFYSSNDAEGCVHTSTIKDLAGLNKAYISDTNCVWLIEVDKAGENFPQTVNIRHGVGSYNNDNRSLQYYYESYIDDNGNLKSTKTNRTDMFAYPYRTCSDQHTYLYFLQRIKDDPKTGAYHYVYFYNPNFPSGRSAESLITQRIAEKYVEQEQKYGVYIVDWREIIYQMALDYFAGQGCSEEEPLYVAEDHYDSNDNFEPIYYKMTDPDHFLYEVGLRNPYYYPTGYTGYEQYYTDMQGFWRQLYNPDYLPEPIYSSGQYTDTVQIDSNNMFYTKTKIWIKPQIQDYNIEYYISPAKSGINQQIEELELATRGSDSEYTNLINKVKNKYQSYVINLAEDTTRLYWNRNVFEQPETINFWIDFLDSDLELAQFSIPQVGDRSKVVNESKSSAIIYTDVPGLILYDKKDPETQLHPSSLHKEIVEKSGYRFIYVPKGFSQFFTISYRIASIKDKIDALLYQYGYCIENITITAIPVYHLQPNTRIFVQDKDTGIDGEYLVNKITLPLTYNGTMSITATKAPERLY